MSQVIKQVLIVSDIEGSSGCWCSKGASFKTKEWRRACVEMSRDVNVVVRSLAEAGVENILVKDFHRTGFNLLPELIDSRGTMISGYHSGPVMGIGNPGQSEGVIFLGMHAASGSDGFLAHTLTSRISRIQVNQQLLPEVALFSASMAHFGIRPIFISGCPTTCRQAAEFIPGMHHYTIDKSNGPDQFDPTKWRNGLARAVTGSIKCIQTKPYDPQGPFDTVISMRDGNQTALKLAGRWGLKYKGPDIFIRTQTLSNLYAHLIDLCYLTPFLKKILPLALMAHNIRGRLGLAWVRKGLKNEDFF